MPLFFEIAYQALMHALLERRRLVEGNSLLELSRSASEVVGPALGGGLLQLLKAPLALALDACSFLASATLICRMHTREPKAQHLKREGSLWQSALIGLREV